MVGNLLNVLEFAELGLTLKKRKHFSYAFSMAGFVVIVEFVQNPRGSKSNNKQCKCSMPLLKYCGRRTKLQPRMVGNP